MGKIRLAVLLLLMFVLAGWCLGQDPQDPISDPVDITAQLTPVNQPAVDPTMAAGSAYTTKVTLQYVDNHKNCGTRNCWSKTTAATIQFASVGYDGFFLGVNGGALYSLPFANTGGNQQAWVSYPNVGGGVIGLAVHDKNQIYGLVSVTGCSSWPSTRRVSVLNSAKTAWSVLPTTACFSQLAVALDGTLVGVNFDLGHDAFYSKDGGASWTLLSGFSWTKMFPVSGSKAYGINTDGYVYAIDLTSGNITFLGGGSTTELTVGPNDIYVKTPSGIYYMDTANHYGTWQHLNGGYTRLTGSGYFVFGQSSTQPYHFNMLAPMVATNTAGSYDCSHFVSGCPIGSVHTATATMKWSDGGLTGTAGVSASSGGCPACQLSAQVFDVDFGCDVIYGVPSGAAMCVMAPSGGVSCSKMGAIFRAAWLLTVTQLAGAVYDYAGVLTWKTAPNFQPGNGYLGVTEGARGAAAFCQVKPWCSNTTAPLGYQNSLLDYTDTSACHPYYTCIEEWLRVPGMAPIKYNPQCTGTVDPSLAVCSTTYQ